MLVISFSGTPHPKAKPTEPKQKTTESLSWYCPLISISMCCKMLSIKYPIPADVKEVSVLPFYLISDPRDIPDLLSLNSLICHQ